MAFQLKENQRAKVKKLFHKDKYTDAFVSTSRGNKEDGFKYSDWTVRFVGKAHKFVLEQVTEGDVLNIISANTTKESYVNKEGTKVYPETAQIVVFECELYKSDKSNQKPVTKKQEMEEPEVPSDEDIPF